MRKALPLVLILLLTSCASNTVLVSVGAACDTYASTLRVLAGLNERGRLRQSDVATVDTVVATVGPLCRDPSSVASTRLLDKIKEGVVALLDIKKDRE